jgi:hypothetical protein
LKGSGGKGVGGVRKGEGLGEDEGNGIIGRNGREGEWGRGTVGTGSREGTGRYGLWEGTGMELIVARGVPNFRRSGKTREEEEAIKCRKFEVKGGEKESKNARRELL